MTRKPIRVLAVFAAIVVVGFAVAAVSRDQTSQPATVADMNHGNVKLAKGEMKRVLNAAAAATAETPEDQLAAEGRKIFRDASLFEHGESCQTCHAEGTSSNRLGTMVHDSLAAVNNDPSPPTDFDGERDPPSLVDLANTAPYFWNGNVPTLAEAVATPVFGHMRAFVPGGLHAEVVPGVDCEAPQTAKGHRDARCDEKAGELTAALIAYLKKVTPPATSFDQGTMSEDALAGEKLFQGKGGCIECHGGPDFTDNLVHNTGVPQITFKTPYRTGTPTIKSNDLGGAAPPPDPGCAATPLPAGCDAPVTTPDLPCPAINQVVKGRCSAFINTPPLRDLANTGPYMHNGAFKTLTDIVNFYNTDSALSPLNLTQTEVQELVAYLKSL